MKNIFLSHESIAIKEAIRFKELIIESGFTGEIFLTSDWESLEAGKPWLGTLLDSLANADGLLTIITNEEAFSNLWINFEVGVAYGAKKLPKIFVFGGIDIGFAKYPIRGIQLISTGDTNRWIKELKSIGCIKVEEYQKEFALLFRQYVRA